jgi:hypothetical protein
MKKTVFILLTLFAITGLFAQERIAVFPFEDRNSVYTKDELDSFYAEFSNEFANKTDDRRFTVLARDDLEKLINMETRFQLSDYSSKEKTAELNRVLNAQQILYCLILKVGNEIRITVSRRSFPELSVLRGGKTISVTNKNQLFGKIPELVQAMVSEIAGGITPVQTYKIGDYGPAGGYVFYDKGVFSNGWRYLEAAPAETEFRAQWGAYEFDIVGTRKEVGFGRRNTEIIVEKLNQLGENGKAAQLCANLNFDGYKDWFLPSEDELELMYKNLRLKGLGGFKTVRDRSYDTDVYWSSSQASNIVVWVQSFSTQEQEVKNGIQTTYTYGLHKYNTFSVRAVRAF